MITIVDYGMGNLGSIANMFRYIGVKSQIVSDPDLIAKSTKILLPGVGAFDAAMEKIASSGLREVLDEKALKEKIPVLGICLGMQLITRSSEEGVLPGLGWINADTLAFKGRVSSALKVPHMGWNLVKPTQQNNPLLRNFDQFPELRFYFVHSYFVHCDEQENALLHTEYGCRFDAGVVNDNIFGVQFHPEKSHRFGMTLFKNFSDL
ncbi:imidazole glycerol phosphate synthase subunit HisH [uncultured Rheinheimera sp.]|uniref:imidazole glycerol phosphate synthase subunit HisH n=1 Tax=uncultured Rheinheimera sp. TaxID=400532 RepID=UPI002597A270|nr:imidazole glycerol phosphate synthase subunit HisH [uncultured Rheinheimera sp.]